MRISRRAVGIVLSLAGCIGPDYQRPPVLLPAQWGTDDEPRFDATNPVASEWWRAFNDPALNRVVELAYRQNLPLKVVALRIEEARGQVGVARARLFPQLQVVFGQVAVQRVSQSAANVGQLDRNYVDYQIGFDVSWEIDLWGKYRRALEAENANLRASELEYYAGIVSLTAEVARTYTMIRTFEVLVEQAQRNATIQEEALQIARSRFENGATSELDVSQATTLLESTRASIPTLQIGREQSEHAMSTLLGRPPGDIEDLLAGVTQIPEAPESIAVGVPMEVLRQRPDIRSAEERAAAQCARVGVAKSELYPAFSLFGTIGFQASTGAGATFDAGDSLFYFAGPRISWPFFNYGRIENNIDIEDARFHQLLVNYQNTVLEAAREVEDALTGFNNAQRAMTFEQSSVTSAERSVQLAVASYREGAVDYQRVLDAQRELLERQNDLIETRSSVATYLIALYKALGGGWESRRGDEPEPEAPEIEATEQ